MSITDLIANNLIDSVDIVDAKVFSNFSISFIHFFSTEKVSLSLQNKSLFFSFSVAERSSFEFLEMGILI